MLAEMDSRLQELQRELEELAVPITRRGVQPHGAGRPMAEPPGSSSAEIARELDEHEAPGASVRPARPASPGRSTSPAGRRPPATPPSPASPPAAVPSAEPPAPKRRARSITAVEGAGRAAAAAPQSAAPAAAPQPAAAAPPERPAPAASGPAPPPTGRRGTGPGEAPAEALVQQTILEAEEEARAIVGEARDRIAEVGARARALLEQALGVPTPRPPLPAPGFAGAARPADERAYEGAVTVEAGPFDDVAQLKAFEDALLSIPGVEEVYIRTFERYYAHFALHVAAPVALVAELRARLAEVLQVIEASGQALRLEIIGDGAQTASPR